MAERTGIFISYSHKDSYYFEELRAMLSRIVRHGRIATWADTQIGVDQSQVYESLGHWARTRYDRGGDRG